MAGGRTTSQAFQQVASPTADARVLMLNDPDGTPDNVSIDRDDFSTWLGASGVYDEIVEDIVGAMIPDSSGNGLTITYNDAGDVIGIAVDLTDLTGTVPVANGGTGASDAATALSNLGGQPLDANLTAIAALAVTDGNIIVGNGTTWVAESGATARTSLGLGNVENTALSTWAGSTNITTLGTIATGTVPAARVSAGAFQNGAYSVSHSSLPLLLKNTESASTSGAQVLELQARYNNASVGSGGKIVFSDQGDGSEYVTFGGYTFADATIGLGVVTRDGLVFTLSQAGSPTFYSKVNAPASTTGRASLNVPAGTAPTSPSNGDMWFVGDVMYRRIGGVTKSVTFT